MGRKTYRRMTQAVYGPDGTVLHEAGDVILSDAPLDTAAVFTEYEVDEPDPDPEPVPEAKPKASRRENITVRPDPAAGGGAAQP